MGGTRASIAIKDFTYALVILVTIMIANFFYIQGYQKGFDDHEKIRQKVVLELLTDSGQVVERQAR